MYINIIIILFVFFAKSRCRIGSFGLKGTTKALPVQNRFFPHKKDSSLTRQISCLYGNDPLCRDSWSLWKRSERSHWSNFGLSNTHTSTQRHTKIYTHTHI